MQKPPKASILIPTTRGDSLATCLTSIGNQTFKDYEVVCDSEKGELAKIRNSLARRAKGEILIFIDDDVRCTEGWLEAIVREFDRDGRTGGVSGPCPIHKRFRRNRDIFRYPLIKAFYDHFFCEGLGRLPGHIAPSGAWTTGATREDCTYEGSVHFLEACNMAFRRDAFWEVGGFHETYRGCGDYSEPDLCFRLREKGYRLIFRQGAKLYHNPSPTGAYKKMAGQSSVRLENYLLFSRRWVNPCFKHTLYKLFLGGYYRWKSLSAI